MLPNHHRLLASIKGDTKRLSSDEKCPAASPLELIKQPPEKVHNAVQRLIMDAVWWVGKKGRDGWESGGEKVQVGYTLLTCGLRTPLNPCSEHFAVCTVCGAGLPFTESLKSQASRESGLPGLLFNFERGILM